MAAESQGSIGCNYHISLNKEMSKNSPYYLGKVRSNFTGSLYTIYSKGENPKSVKNKSEWRSTVANVHY
jgi:hypothetical protein